MNSYTVELERYTTYRAPCPVNGCEGRFDITRQVREARKRKERQNAGPWFCDECGTGVRWSVDEPDPVSSSAQATGTITNERKVERLVLLELDPKHKAVQAVVRGMRFEGGPPTDMDEDELDRFHYNERSCPTNHLNYIEVLLEGDSADPHGLLRFVKAVDLDADLKKHLCEICSCMSPAHPDDWKNALSNISAEQVRALFDAEEGRDAE
jgi:hypothetical protein